MMAHRKKTILVSSVSVSTTWNNFITLSFITELRGLRMSRRRYHHKKRTIKKESNDLVNEVTIVLQLMKPMGIGKSETELERSVVRVTWKRVKGCLVYMATNMDLHILTQIQLRALWTKLSTEMKRYFSAYPMHMQWEIFSHSQCGCIWTVSGRAESRRSRGNCFWFQVFISIVGWHGIVAGNLVGSKETCECLFKFVKRILRYDR